MNQSFRNLLFLLFGITLVFLSRIFDAILIEQALITNGLLVIGIGLTLIGVITMRTEIAGFFKKQRGERLLRTIGLIGIVVALCNLSIRFPARMDMTDAHRHSLSKKTSDMLARLETPVHITFFHDQLMTETVDFYEQMAAITDKVTVEFHDPMLNPSMARVKGVEFAGTAIMESEDRKIQVHSPLEVDIANAVLKISQGIQQTVCFLDGHGEPDPFSLEKHDHMEGTGGDHSHGLGSRILIHERHGMAKLRTSLESMNYVAQKVSLVQGTASLEACDLFIVAGPQTRLMDSEVKTIDEYINAGNNVLLMLDPFIETGLEPIIRKLGVILDNDLVIDPKSHFWADVSSPAVTQYNRHSITEDIPLTFFPGARSLSPTENRVPETYVRPLVNSSTESFGEKDASTASFTEGVDTKGPLTMIVIIERDPSRINKMQPLLEDTRNEEATPIKSTADSEDAVRTSRIAIVGDSDFATNSFFHMLGNGKLILNTINYLTVQENLIGLEPKTMDIPQVTLTNEQMKGVFFMSILLIPSLMALIGIAVWWRRR